MIEGERGRPGYFQSMTGFLYPVVQIGYKDANSACHGYHSHESDALLIARPCFNRSGTTWLYQPAHFYRGGAGISSHTFDAGGGRGDTKAVRSLLRQGESVNAVSPQGTALTQAAQAGQKEVVLLLLKEGADPNLGQAESGSSPLHQAAASGDVQSIRVLVAAGAKLDQRDAADLTPLAYAVRNGSLPAAKALIAAGADVNAVVQGRSLLMHVAAQGALLMAQVLIKAGADVNYQAVSGETALSLAREHRQEDLEMLLLQSGARS